MIEAEQQYKAWGFDAETPRGAALYDALFAIAPIEWNRIGDAQDVTMRVIGEQLLSDAVRGTTYVRGEVSQQRPRLPSLPPARHRVYCSPHNAGADELIQEVKAALEVEVTATSSIEELGSCEHFFVLLDARTWTGSSAAALAAEITQALDQGVPLLLVHEMPSALPEAEGGRERHAVEFASFFVHTPSELLEREMGDGVRGIYSKVAIALKPGVWRQVGMVRVVQAMGGVLSAGWCVSGERVGAVPRRSTLARVAMSVKRRSKVALANSEGVEQLTLRSERYAEATGMSRA